MILPLKQVAPGKVFGIDHPKHRGPKYAGGDVASLVRRSHRNIVLWSEVTFSEARHRAHEHSEQR